MRPRSRLRARRGRRLAVAAAAVAASSALRRPGGVSGFGVPASQGVPAPSQPTQRVEGASDLALAYAEVVEMLRSSEPVRIDGLREGVHELPAMMPRSAWNQIGRLVAEHEHPEVLVGSKWASLRLDGCLWGTLLGRLRARGIVGPGYSSAIGEAMRDCCRAVMDEFKGTIAYTHSDEMTILMEPRRLQKNGKHIDFPYNGRIQKWVSIAASVATALFNRKLGRLAVEHGVTLDESLLAHFDCRAGVFDSKEEALSLLLWRAYDCGVNCAQDACYLNHAPPECVKAPFVEKMLWLDSVDLLPMDPHQAYGTLFVRGVGEFDALVPERNETVRVSRTVNVHVNDGASGSPRNLLNFERRGLPLLPEEGDERMALRPGSFWRYAGPSGTGEESRRADRRGPARPRARRPRRRGA